MGVDLWPTDRPEPDRVSHYAWGEWDALRGYIIHVAPSGIANKALSWDSNDGLGLDRKESTALADSLQTTIDDGYASICAAMNPDLDTGEIRRFIGFLRDCGGFKIF
jgi:hypothetical protein